MILGSLFALPVVIPPHLQYGFTLSSPPSAFVKEQIEVSGPLISASFLSTMSVNHDNDSDDPPINHQHHIIIERGEDSLDARVSKGTGDQIFTNTSKFNPKLPLQTSVDGHVLYRSVQRHLSLTCMSWTIRSWLRNFKELVHKEASSKDVIEEIRSHVMDEIYKNPSRKSNTHLRIIRLTAAGQLAPTDDELKKLQSRHRHIDRSPPVSQHAIVEEVDEQRAILSQLDFEVILIDMAVANDPHMVLDTSIIVMLQYNVFFLSTRLGNKSQPMMTLLQCQCQVIELPLYWSHGLFEESDYACASDCNLA